jgi:UDP-N-acetylmuramoyl-L-alanyl-D-glutamate--2,6-diaminopimelate ligase
MTKKLEITSMDKILNTIKKYLPKKLFKALQPAYHFILSWLASLLYLWPSEKMIIIGVTGTTGKTTSVFLIAKTLETAGYKVGFTSTAMFNDGEKEWLNDKKMTMVGRFFTQRMLRKMAKHKCQYAIVETTSEGIRQFRHRFINYDILVFTGLYPEHIDSHGSFDNYKKTKGKLFAHLKKCKTKYADDKKFIHRKISGLKKTDLNRVKKTIIANFDDENADYFLDFWAEQKFGYASGEEANIKNTNDVEIINYNITEANRDSTSFALGRSLTPRPSPTPAAGRERGDDKLTLIRLQLLGEFNVANAMTAVCAALSQGVSEEEIKNGLEKIEGVAGRLEKIDEGQSFTVIVDYAFEPHAVEKLYKTVKLIPHKKVIHVLGSTGGGRDEARRPLLGRLAGEFADMVIVTNEDPYDDDPNLIIDQVAIGAEDKGKVLDKDLFKILDRREAIKKALESAEENDIVLITGKGSEQAICVANGEKITWDDRAVVRGMLENWGR